MATGQEHYTAAEQELVRAGQTTDPTVVRFHHDRAQVHAVLAQAAATTEHTQWVALLDDEHRADLPGTYR